MEVNKERATAAAATNVNVQRNAAEKGKEGPQAPRSCRGSSAASTKRGGEESHAAKEEENA